MGLFEKIKNALFEEEYVEIEEKPKKPKKEVFKKEVERPIAKKVLLPKKEEQKIEELDEEEYLDDSVETRSDVFNDFVVPKGYVFAVGDNRGNSSDCRNFGCIPLEKVEGIVVCRWFPFSEFKMY